jgi:hypothetical protein
MEKTHSFLPLQRFQRTVLLPEPGVSSGSSSTLAGSRAPERNLLGRVGGPVNEAPKRAGSVSAEEVVLIFELAAECTVRRVHDAPVVKQSSYRKPLPVDEP